MDNGYITSEDFTETSVRVKKLGPRQLGKYTCRAQVILFYKNGKKKSNENGISTSVSSVVEF